MFKNSELNRLCENYARWVEAQGLPHMSADELICEGVTQDQRLWLSSFIARWEVETKKEY